MSRVIDIFTTLTRLQKRLIQLGIDTALILLCFVLAMALRLESLAFVTDLQTWAIMAPVVSLTLFVFAKLGLYRTVIRYITGQALPAILGGVAASALFMHVTALAFGLPIPASVPVIYAALLLLAVGGARFMARSLIMKENLREKTPALIYGAGSTGRRLAEALRQGDSFAPVAFVDDDPGIQGQVVNGLRIMPPADLPRSMAETRAKAVLLAMPGIGRTRRREIIRLLEPLGMAIRDAATPFAQRAAGQSVFPSLPTVSPEDLLGRDAIPPDQAMMARTISGKVVLVTGAGGSIGAELCRQILPLRPARLILLDVCEYALYRINDELQAVAAAAGGEMPEIVPILGSVQNSRRVHTVLSSYGVQTVFHAAAYKHVPLVEDNIVEGVRNNVFGTRTLAEAAVEARVERFILISSDKAVRPSNVMGATKRLAELICQSMAQSGCSTCFSMVRFGNVLGSSGSVIPRFREQIAQGGPVTVTHREMTRYFMTITEAAQLVIQASAMARGGDVFILDMGEPVRIFDLAQSMIRLHGLEPYVIEADQDDSAVRGDIGIRITGPRKGEKLYEELLIAEDPRGTEHPRILTANETRLAVNVLDELLDGLLEACLEHDDNAIRALLKQGSLGYLQADATMSEQQDKRHGPSVLVHRPERPVLHIVPRG